MNESQKQVVRLFMELTFSQQKEVHEFLGRFITEEGKPGADLGMVKRSFRESLNLGPVSMAGTCRTCGRLL